MRIFTGIVFLFLINNAFGQSVLYPSDNYRLGFGFTITTNSEYLFVSTWTTSTEGQIGESVYVFEKVGDSWLETDRLFISDDPLGTECFGCSLSANNNFLFIGAPSDTINGIQSGVVHVYQKESNSWIYKEKLFPSDASVGQGFGGQISLGEDYAIISSAADDINDLNNSGSVYIFTKDQDSWVEVTKIIPSDPTSNAVFGNSPELSDEYAFIGAPSALDNDSLETGAIYIFKKEGNDWIEQNKLTPEDGSRFDGFSKPVYKDNTLFIAANKSPGNNDFYKGAAYLYSEDGGQWTTQTKLVPFDGNQDDKSLWKWAYNGEYIALSNSDDAQFGTVYLFKKIQDQWEQINTLSGSPGKTDRYGWDLHLSEDELFVGAWATADEGNDNIPTGAVYVYDLGVLTSTEDISRKSQSILNLSPNPTQDLLIVTLQGHAAEIIEHLEVYSISGQLLQLPEQSTKSDQRQITTASLKAGTYLIKVYTNQGEFVQPFVKMK